MPPKLGVNIDHVATLRQARGGRFPDPVDAALLCEKAGADSIVAHLREDRRHIQDHDIKLLKKKIKTVLNLEMSIAPEILKLACQVKPYQATLVPENRRELTTEGGLDLLKNFKRIHSAVKKLEKHRIKVSLFIDPDLRQINQAKNAGAKIIEIHTGSYADAKNIRQKNKYLAQIKIAVKHAQKLGLTVNAGHGLDYANARTIARIKGINELNIGYAIIGNSLYLGLYQAVKQMCKLIRS